MDLPIESCPECSSAKPFRITVRLVGNSEVILPSFAAQALRGMRPRRIEFLSHHTSSAERATKSYKKATEQ